MFKSILQAIHVISPWPACSKFWSTGTISCGLWATVQTYLPTYLPACLPTYLPTNLPTYLQQTTGYSPKRSHIKNASLSHRDNKKPGHQDSGIAGSTIEHFCTARWHHNSSPSSSETTSERLGPGRSTSKTHDLMHTLFQSCSLRVRKTFFYISLRMCKLQIVCLCISKPTCK